MATNKFRSRDLYQSSDALARTGEEPALEHERDKIIFVHDETEAFKAALNAYLTNQPVPVLTFIESYKRLRALMYNAAGRRP